MNKTSRFRHAYLVAKQRLLNYAPLNSVLELVVDWYGLDWKQTIEIRGKFTDPRKDKE